MRASGKDSDITVGAQVVYRGCMAVVKYQGPLHHASGSWVGVQFADAAEGRNDGSTGGKKYIDRPPNRCLFVRPGNVVPMASSSGGHQSAFSQWQVFDAVSEGEFLKTNELGQTAENIIRSVSGHKLLPKLALKEPGPDYKGPRFSFKDDKTTEEEVNNLTTYLKAPATEPAKKPVHPYYICELLDRTSTLLRKQVTSAVHSLEVPEQGTLVLCGDTHGQLEDLLWVFFKHGPPAPDRVYLMNGDMADRGEQAVEVIAVLCAYKLLYPTSVYMNKGNHEDRLMNLRYGFHEEVRSKYPRHYQSVFDRFQHFFFGLPLATTIGKQVFVVHAGLCRKPVRLNLLDSLDYKRAIPDAPKSNLHDLIFYDLLWSDPQTCPGVGPNPRGGDTISFGPDVTQKFLAMNSLGLVIRSHQVPETVDSAGFPRGFSWHHPFPSDSKVKPLCKAQPGMCLTVFSASNYTGTNANMGGVVLFKGSVGNIEILEHYAQDVSYLYEVEKETADATEKFRAIASHEKAAREKMLTKAVGLMRYQALGELQSMIVRKKQDLFDWFWAMDSDKDLHLKPELWREGCASVLSEDLPWLDIQESLQVVDGSSKLVQYPSFLSRFQIRFRNKMGLHGGFRRAITDRCYQMLLMSDLSMRETFAVLDRNDDGLVSIHEFNEVLSSLGTGMTKPQLQALMKTIVVHGCHPGAGGKLKIEDFLSRLQLKYSSTHAKCATVAQEWVPTFLNKVAKDILQVVQKNAKRAEEMVLQSTAPIGYLTEFFNGCDLDKNGYLEQMEFIRALRVLPCCKNLTEEQLNQLASYCDIDENGRINYLEFLHTFHVEDSSGSELSEDVLEYVYRVLHFEFTQPMRRAFHALGEVGGKVTAMQFQNVIETVNSLTTPSPLGKDQIQCLVDTLSLDDSGRLDFEDYLGSFEIVDILLDEE
eukprot:gene4289-6626_t